MRCTGSDLACTRYLLYGLTRPTVYSLPRTMLLGFRGPTSVYICCWIWGVIVKEDKHGNHGICYSGSSKKVNVENLVYLVEFGAKKSMKTMTIHASNLRYKHTCTW